jgi:hypothetical protein
MRFLRLGWLARIICLIALLGCREEPPLSVADVVGHHGLMRLGGRVVPWADATNVGITGVDGGNITITSAGRFTVLHGTRFGATVHEQQCTTVRIVGDVRPAGRILALESTQFGQATHPCGQIPGIETVPVDGSWSLWTVREGATLDLHTDLLGPHAIYRSRPLQTLHGPAAQ